MAGSANAYSSNTQAQSWAYRTDEEIGKFAGEYELKGGPLSLRKLRVATFPATVCSRRFWPSSRSHLLLRRWGSRGDSRKMNFLRSKRICT